jgi:hypothetical protein
MESKLIKELKWQKTQGKGIVMVRWMNVRKLSIRKQNVM